MFDETRTTESDTRARHDARPSARTGAQGNPGRKKKGMAGKRGERRGAGESGEGRGQAGA